MPEAILCHDFLAGGAVWVTFTDALRDGSTDGEVKLAAGDPMSLVAIRNKALVLVRVCERNTPVVGPVVYRVKKFKYCVVVLTYKLC